MNRLAFDARLRYESGFVLDARFEAGAGVTALVGPSGSGKSTILSLVAGVLRSQEALIMLGSRTLEDTKRGIRLPPESRRVGVVFQDQLLFPHLSVRQNLLFGRGRHDSRPIALERVVEILEIGELLSRSPATLSGGQRQRVALGRAILRGPEMLLIDEPLVALERGLKDRILDYLERAIKEWHIPTLYVSHDQADVQRIAEKIVTIEDGRVIQP